MPSFDIENSFKKEWLIAGIDEAGRGPLAGPVVAGAVIFKSYDIASELMDNLDDSKKLSALKREKLFDLIYASGAYVGVGTASAEEIDRFNILQATFLAMKRALENIKEVKANYALIDGNRNPVLYCPCKTIVKGDALSFSIAAASIIAKVTRDRIMEKEAEKYPQYAWDKNSGYGTKAHLEAIKKYGITPLHRKSFYPVKDFICQEKEEEPLLI